MEKVTFYTTLENQVRSDGSYGLLYDHFTDYSAALAKFYTICAAAAISGIPYHSAHILQCDGRIVRQEIFDNRPYPEPEPEPEESEIEPEGGEEEPEEQNPEPEP